MSVRYALNAASQGGSAYVLTEGDLGMVRSVKALVKSSSYRNLFTVDNHILVLDGIRRKLAAIDAGEMSSGIANWQLRAHLSEIKDVVKSLRELRNSMFCNLA